MRKLLMIIVLLVSLSSCKTKAFEVSFGSGGGFTGIYKTYTLSSNGKMYFTEGNLNIKVVPKSKTPITTLTKKDIKEIEALIDKINFAGSPMHMPGNMSSFLNFTRGGKTYDNIWSGETSGNQDMDQLYQKLNSFIPKK